MISKMNLTNFFFQCTGFFIECQTERNVEQENRKFSKFAKLVTILEEISAQATERRTEARQRKI